MTFRLTPFLQLLALSLISIYASAPATAAPCHIEQNEHGMWISDCTIAELTGKTIEVEIVGPPVWLHMPDLWADDGDYFVSGNVVEISVRTGNSGTWPAQDFDVTANIEIRYANGGVYSTRQLTGRVPGVDAGDRVWTTLGTITLPDRVSDWDVYTEFLVDSSGMSGGGEVWELVETNNVFDDGFCRVYGEDPLVEPMVDACQ